MRAMHPKADIDTSLTFYYDETNNIKKFRLKDGAFNVNHTANFVLGGLAFKGDRPNIEDIFDGIPLQANIVEVKLDHIAKHGFTDCLKSRELRTFLGNVHSKDLYLHISSLNFLYYSLVDIVDSVLTDEIMHLVFPLKNALYVACKNRLNEVLPLFEKYNYPNISDGEVRGFIDGLITIVQTYEDDEKIGSEISILTEALQYSSEKNELFFVTGKDSTLLIEGLQELYERPIFLIRNAQHVFDNEAEVKSLLEQYPLMSEGEKLENFKFIDSKEDKLIQASDILMGLVGKLFKYVNTNTKSDMFEEVSTMSELQLENFDLLFSLFDKTNSYNEGLIHYIDALEEISKVEFLGSLRNKNA